MPPIFGRWCSPRRLVGVVCIGHRSSGLCSPRLRLRGLLFHFCFAWFGAPRFVPHVFVAWPLTPWAPRRGALRRRLRLPGRWPRCCMVVSHSAEDVCLELAAVTACCVAPVSLALTAAAYWRLSCGVVARHSVSESFGFPQTTQRPRLALDALQAHSR